jgi:hypothetical protein
MRNAGTQEKEKLNLESIPAFLIKNERGCRPWAQEIGPPRGIPECQDYSRGEREKSVWRLRTQFEGTLTPALSRGERGKSVWGLRTRFEGALTPALSRGEREKSTRHVYIMCVNFRS